jgi:hypothetical protein
MKQITAVNWLIDKLITENEVTLKGENYKLFELAKEIEKKQMEDAWYAGDEDGAVHEFKQYYNETFKSE